MRLALVFVALCATAFAAKKVDVTLRVLGSETGTVGGGTYASGNANCNTTVYGNSANTNCSGTAMSTPMSFGFLSINAEVDGQPATLECDGRWHWTCYNLRPGTYKAQIKGGHIWVETYNFARKKKVVKFAIK